MNQNPEKHNFSMTIRMPSELHRQLRTFAASRKERTTITDVVLKGIKKILKESKW